MELIELFYIVDEFCKSYETKWRRYLIKSGVQVKHKSSRLSMSEILTIMIYFHLSGYRTFKWYYEKAILGNPYLKSCFPNAVSYNQFLRLSAQHLLPIVHCLAFLMSLSTKTGLYFIDSTSIVVCSNLRINSHKVFAETAARGKTSEGWFFGFKLHIVINDRGQLMAAKITTGNVADCSQDVVESLTKNLTGRLFGDRGYISSSLFKKLWAKGLKLVTGIKKNMKNKLVDLADKILLRRRFIIETVNDHLKNSEQIEHSRHRSPAGFLVNLITGLIAYQVQPKKPSLNLRRDLELVCGGGM